MPTIRYLYMPLILQAITDKAVNIGVGVLTFHRVKWGLVMKSAIMIAATGSGCGKTTITCALLAAMKKRGLDTRAFKCGPDYIDPMFHKKVIGISSKNLDLFFSDKKMVRESFYSDNDSDISIVEGVMGLYDGTDSADNAGSSYDLACKLDIPIVLVVDAHGMGRSLLAVIKGFLSMDENRQIQGVILNRISPMYYETIKGLIEKELSIKVMGYYPKMTEGCFESRYLGLKMPDEIDCIREQIDAAAEIAADTIDLDGLLSLGYIAQEKLTDISGKNIINGQSKVKIAVARDEAFCFFYEDNLELLKSLGAELIEFSPIKDTKLPDDIDGLLLGGGYPELYAERLSDNTAMREAVLKAVSGGLPSLAECGGFMYLHDSIKVDDKEYPMVGAISGTCDKKNRLVRFGYLNIEEKSASFFSADDRKIRGHEFHYYDSSNNGSDATSVKPGGSKSWEAAHITENHWWGFAHLYYPSNKAFAKAFVDKCSACRLNRK